MGLTIKNDEANRLVHELAAVTGESLTTAVTYPSEQRTCCAASFGVELE